MSDFFNEIIVKDLKAARDAFHEEDKVSAFSSRYSSYLLMTTWFTRILSQLLLKILNRSS